MQRGNARRLTTALALAAGITFSGGALAQKPGGILRIYHRDTPASMSILGEATISAEMPMMAVFNNLVEFDQHTPPEQRHGHCSRPGNELVVECRRDRVDL